MSLSQLRQVSELHTETQVGLIRTVALHRLDPRHTLERLRKFDVEHLFEHIFCPTLEDLQYVLLLDERHLAVDLSELRLTIGTQVLVAEATYDLEVAVVTSHHQQLLQGLGRLRQSVELIGVHTARNNEVARTLRGRFDQIGGLDFEEALLVEERTHCLSHTVAQDHCTLQGGTTQVEVAVTHTQIVATVRVLLDGERRSLCHVENGQLFGCHLDIARCHFGVLRLTLDNATRYLNDIFATQLSRSLASLSGRVLLDYNLGDTIAVAQVDKGHCTEVAHLLHPTGEGYCFIDVAASQTAASVSSVHSCICYFCFVSVFRTFSLRLMQPTKIQNYSQPTIISTPKITFCDEIILNLEF